MSTDRKELDLIIRAAVQGGKSIEQVAKSIGDIEKALESQADAAKRGEGNIRELDATLLALKKAQDQLLNQAGLIGQFDKLGNQIGETSTKLDGATKNLEEYVKTLTSIGPPTERQASKLLSLTKAAERQGATLSRQRIEYEALGSALKDAGIDTSNLANTGDRAREAAAQLGLTIAKTNDAIENYAVNVRKAREAEKLRNDELAASAKLQADELTRQQRLRDFKQAITTQRLSEIKVTEDEVESRRRAAASAELQARGYKTLGTAIKTLGGTSGGLRSVVDGIVNPGAAARTTLEGVEQQVRAVSVAATSARGPIENYKTLLADLTASAKSLGDKASLVDSFSKQTAALRSSRAEFSQARAQVLQYAEAVRTSAGQNDALQASLRQAQTRLAAAQKNLAEQLVSTRSLRDAMREAGLATNDLAGTQARLAAAAKGSVSAMNDLAAAKKRYGTAVQEATAAQGMFENSGRTTLSWLQRMRGEVLSLVAAYVGIYGALEGANKSIDAFNAKQAIGNQLALSVGNDNVKIADEYAYIRGQADRLGLSFESAAKGYAKFSAAASLAGRDSQEIKYIFESFAEVGRVAGLSADNMDGVFKALEQVISKGSIQAEELRGQLGDRLFGAFQVAAEALKKEFPNLDKAMKEGKVTSEQLIKIAEKYKEIVGDRLPEATRSLMANQERLNSSIFDFKVLVAEQGFADEYGKLVESLSKFFKSSDGATFAKNIADGLSAVAQGLRWIVDNAELVKQTIYVGLGLLGARAVATLAISLAALPAMLKAVAVQGALAATAVGNIGNAFKVLTAGLVGWEIGTILSQKFGVVRQFGVSLVVAFEATWTAIKYGAQIIWAEIPAVFMDGLAKLGNLLTSGVRSILGIFSAAAKAVGNDQLANSIDTAISAIEFKIGRIGNASATLRKQLVADLAAIRKTGQEMFNEARREPGATSVSGVGSPATPKPTTIKPSKKNTDDDEKAAEKRIKVKEQLENELTSIEARIEKNEKDTLSRRLDAIDLTYKKLLKKIREFGGKDGGEMEARLTKDVTELKLQETRKFNDAMAAEHEQLQRKLETVDAAAGRKEKTDLQARLDAVRLQYEQTYRDIADYKAKLELNGLNTSPADEQKRRLDGGVQSLQNLETQKYYEDAINALLDQRKVKLDTIAVQEKTGLLTTIQAREQAAAIVLETQPKIEALAQEGLNYANAMITAAEATGANTTSLETLRLKLIEAQGSAKGLRTEFLSAQQVNEMLATGGTQAFDTMSTAIGEAVMGMRSWKDATQAAGAAFMKFAADFLKQIALMIMKEAILKALQNSSIGGMIGGAVSSVAKKHRGGVVGSGGVTMAANADWFAGAPRYHGGGIAGLAPDEYPTILKRNEEVLTQSDPRNVLNGGLSNGAAPQTNMKIINMIDSASVVSEGLSSQDGERAVINLIRANKTAIRSIIGN